MLFVFFYVFFFNMIGVLSVFPIRRFYTKNVTSFFKTENTIFDQNTGNCETLLFWGMEGKNWTEWSHFKHYEENWCRISLSNVVNKLGWNLIEFLHKSINAKMAADCIIIKNIENAAAYSQCTLLVIYGMLVNHGTAKNVCWSINWNT